MNFYGIDFLEKTVKYQRLFKIFSNFWLFGIINISFFTLFKT